MSRAKLAERLLTKSWNETFPNSVPLAHELKLKFNERWFRIHTLPESKRYPENEVETQEILNRHNLILSDLFGENDKYFLLTVLYSSSNLKNEKAEKSNLQNHYWQSVNVAEEDEEVYYWHIYFDEKNWAENSLNELFRLVINDEIRNVMLFSIEKQILYHPYDGGADIIFESSNLRDFYKAKYKNWLSNHPLGL